MALRGECMEKVFDYDKALERFMGEKDILLEVIPPYIEALLKHIDIIKNLDPGSECQKIRDIAHSIKGSSLNLEIVPLGKLAEQLEDLAYENKSKKVAELIPSVVEASDRVVEALKNY